MNSKFNPFPELLSERLTLRQIRLADTSEVHYLRSDQEVNKYIKRPATYSMKEAEQFIEKSSGEIAQGKSIQWGIAISDTSKIIGSICLWNFSDHEKTAEVGYDLKSDLHGRGFMTEAMQCVLDYGFSTLKLDKVEAYTHYKNAASIALLRKFGFSLVEEASDEGNSNNRIFLLNCPK